MGEECGGLCQGALTDVARGGGGSLVSRLQQHTGGVEAKLLPLMQMDDILGPEQRLPGAAPTTRGMGRWWVGAISVLLCLLRGA